MQGRTLILQGGGFRTSFTAGVLDAFMEADYFPFDNFISVSAGSLALSYYLAGQKGDYYKAICKMTQDPQFMKWKRIVSSRGVIDIEYFRNVLTEMIPLDFQQAYEKVMGKENYMVLTDRQTGSPCYYSPTLETWLDVLMASCTIPFVTKGSHLIDGRDFMDGGWSDPLPIEWSHKRGAKEVTIIRTLPRVLKLKQAWEDYFGSLIYSFNDNLRWCFETCHLKYNLAVDFMENPPIDLMLTEIVPKLPLHTGTYSNNLSLVELDYIYGKAAGEAYFRNDLSD